jgi:hypothetical protein
MVVLPGLFEVAVADEFTFISTLPIIHNHLYYQSRYEVKFLYALQEGKRKGLNNE